MSHSKVTKKGRSQYVERWNPLAKRFVVSCSLCGHTGFSPSILEEGFATTLQKKAIVGQLQKVLNPLHLDELCRCSVCAPPAKS
jgi:hypothetical protein